jgi:iron-sulfur cluster assembly protein
VIFARFWAISCCFLGGCSAIISSNEPEVPTVAIEQTEPIATNVAVVSLTERATDKLREIIAKQERHDLALRVYVTPGGCSGFSYGMTFADGTEEDDTVVETQGVRVVVDPMSAMYIKGSEIDFVDALMGGGFALRNPNAVSSCGCGQSFRTAEQTGTAKACQH